MSAFLSVFEYNTRLVLLATALLGMAAGQVGTFLLLRRRSLLGDTFAHATLPGLAFAFIGYTLLMETRTPTLLLWAGAAASGLFGCVVVSAILRFSKLKEDAALGIVLSVFFGFGVVGLSLAQSLPGVSAAGLEAFLYGKTATLLRADLLHIAAVSAVAMLTTLLFFKELRVFCFDRQFSASLGRPGWLFDGMVIALLTLVAVAGLQAVGLVLIIALLIIPPVAASFWSTRLSSLYWLAGLIGAVSAVIGTIVSTTAPRLPAGAIIVLAAGVFFVISLFFGSDRGVVQRMLTRLQLKRRMLLDHLLRALFEITESGDPSSPVHIHHLLRLRSWSLQTLEKVIRRANRLGFVALEPDAVSLTAAGHQAAARATRNHRLWEIYLIEFAAIAPSHVDRDADAIEHILPPDMIRRLEERLALAAQAPLPDMPASPHPLPEFKHRA